AGAGGARAARHAATLRSGHMLVLADSRHLSAGCAMTDTRGILFPSRLPTFHRVLPPASLEPLVRWFWHPRWQLAPGQASRQEILPFPASNLVVSPDGVVLAGPTTRVAHRELSGSGWALGALLRPAGLASLST